MEETFEKADAGASKTYPQQCSALRKNGFVMIKDRPCKIVEMSTSKTGKHGHAKVHMVGIDIFDGKKFEDICPSTHNMDVPNVNRKEYQLCGCDPDGYLSLMEDTTGEMREDIRVEEPDLRKQIEAAVENDDDARVTILKAMGTEKPIALKCANK